MLIGTLLPSTLIPHEVQAVGHLLRPRVVIVRTAGSLTASLSQVARAEGAQRWVVHVRTLGALVPATAAQAAEKPARLATESQRAAQNGKAARFGAAGGRGRRGDCFKNVHLITCIDLWLAPFLLDFDVTW